MFSCGVWFELICCLRFVTLLQGVYCLLLCFMFRFTELWLVVYSFCSGRVLGVVVWLFIVDIACRIDLRY